eukprot:jgi/Botrbrau1/13949/Bobra.250_1s0004.1
MAQEVKPAQGRIPAAMAKVRSGSLEEALGAALTLAEMVGDADGQVELAREGTVLALLRVFDCPSLKHEESLLLNRVLLFILGSSLAMTAEMLMAFSHPDSRIAFAAIAVIQEALVDKVMFRRTLAAGAAPALVAALAHPSPYCRSAAAFVSGNTASASPEVRSALQQAGLVPALVRVLREGPPQDCPQPPSKGVFTAWDSALPDLSRETSLPPWADPHCFAWATLFSLSDKKGIAEEIGAEEDFPAIWARSVKQQLPTAKNAVAVLEKVVATLAAGPRMPAFTASLMSEGFPEIIASLIRPDDVGEPRLACKVVGMIAEWTKENSKPVASALVRYIEASGNVAMRLATLALSRISMLFESDPERFVEFTLGDNPVKMVESLSRFMLSCACLEDSASHLLLLAYLQWGDSTLLPAAVDAGFIPGILRVMREARTKEVGKDPTFLEMIWNVLSLIVDFGEPRYVKQALRCGLLEQVKITIPDAASVHRIHAIGVVKGLLRYREGLEQMRRERIWPNMLINAADSSDVSFLLRYTQTILEVNESDHHLAAELLAMGALERLQRDRDRDTWDLEWKRQLKSRIKTLEDLIIDKDATADLRAGRVKVVRRGGLQPPFGRPAAANDRARPPWGSTQQLGPSAEDIGRCMFSTAVRSKGVRDVIERTFHKADYWRSRGGIKEAMASIRSASQVKAMAAALVLGHLAGDAGATAELAHKGTLRTLLLVFDHPSPETEEFAALFFTVIRVLMESPTAASQIVAAFSDPDPRVAFAAAAVSRLLLLDKKAAAAMVAAGVAPALVAMLSHPSPYCRSAAAMAASAVGQCPQPRRALRDAGLIPALLDLVGQQNVDPPPPPPEAGVFRNFRYQMSDLSGSAVEAPLGQPQFMACIGLTDLIFANWNLAEDVAALDTAVHNITWCMQNSTRLGELAAVPARLLILLLKQLTDLKHCKRFAESVWSERLFYSSIKGLIKSRQDALVLLGVQAVEGVAPGVSNPTLHVSDLTEVMEALAEYLRHGGRYIGKAAIILVCLLPHLKEEWKACIRSTPEFARERLAKNLARCMIHDDPKHGIRALLILMDHVTWGGGSVLSYAIQGGLITGLFRLLGTPDGNELEAIPRSNVRGSLFGIVESPSRNIVLQALRTDLLDEVKYAIRNGNNALQLIGVELVRGLLKSQVSEEAMRLMRQAGIWPGALLQLADSQDTSMQRDLTDQISKMFACSPAAAAELVDAGILKRLLTAVHKVRGLNAGSKLFVGKAIGYLQELRDQQPRAPAQTSANQEAKELRTKGQYEPEKETLTQADAAAASNKAGGSVKEEVTSSHAGRKARGGDAVQRPRRPKRPCICAQCGKESEAEVIFQWCSACRSVYYCGRVCQVEHWPSHKAACKAKQAQASAHP